MIPRRPFLRRLQTVLALLALAACGGGDRPPDVFPSNVFPTPQAVAGPDAFLLFVNRLQAPGGPPPIDSEAYARAYYRAVDPNDQRTTLAAWRTANDFDLPGGLRADAVFGDFRDLGYGRRMSARCDADGGDPTRCAKGGRVAFVVENFLVNPGAEGYGARINLDAAQADDRQWIVSINAIEYAATTPGGVRYARYYSFDPKTGQRVLMQDLDGRGPKALPGACITCHGGRADALEPDPDPRFDWRMPLLRGSLANQRGDVRGRLHPFEVDALTFAGGLGAATAQQQDALKTMNRMVLCTYPLSATSKTTPDHDECRDNAVGGEWQGGAARVVVNGYGGAALPSPTFRTVPPPVPAGWQGTHAGAGGDVDKADLYRRVVDPSCMACHRLLGTDLSHAIDFETFDDFNAYRQRHHHLVFERGNMPLARVPFQRFWSRDPADGAMARRLVDALARIDPTLRVARDAAGDPLPPGSPVAIAGPGRRVNAGTTLLSAAESLYADGFRWTLRTAAPGVTLSNATGPTATLTATVESGALSEVDLVATRDGLTSAAATFRVHVNGAAERYAPATVTFAQVRTLLDGTCTGCHAGATTPPALAPASPRLPFDGSDDEVWRIVRSRINFDHLAASQILRKPSGEHHNTLGGGTRVYGWHVDALPGDPARADVDQMINWILAGAKR